MSGAALAALIVVVLAAAGAWRRRTLRASWAWNDVMLQVHFGGRLVEVYVAEVRSVRTAPGLLLFVTERSTEGIEARWVTPEAASAIGAACGLEADLVLGALAGHAELWSGPGGGFRLPPMAG